MIKKIYSKINPSVLLHIIHTNELNQGQINELKRHELTEPDILLQAGLFEIPKNTNFKAHKHNLQDRKTTQTHEAILVVKGSIELSIFDVDNSLVESHILGEGDCSFIINGGHKIKTLEDTHLFEFKNGPYSGPEKDRTYFEG